jgi:2-phosphosulfolactate phosphatase
MKQSVVINCFPSSVSQYRCGYTIVAIDVIRATTTAITAVALGRRCFVADTLESARRIATGLPGALLVGELSGDMPEGFDMNNSPAELTRRNDVERPMVLLSTSGTQLAYNASRCEEPAYLACFRNFTAVARQLAGRHERVAIIGAGSRNDFREEDQMCCAWIAEQLINSGSVAEDRQTMEIVEHWSGLPPSACSISNSVAYLRRTGQLEDFDFIMAHIDDLDVAYAMEGDEVVVAAGAGQYDAGGTRRCSTPTTAPERLTISLPSRARQVHPITPNAEDAPGPTHAVAEPMQADGMVSVTRGE